MKSEKAPSQSLVIEQLVVKRDRVMCELLVEKEEYRYTTAVLMSSLLEILPDLESHTCKNSQGTSFASVMDHTSTPHLLEHMVIDLQAKASRGSSHTFVGTSEWLNERAGRARVEVSFTDDLNALRAFRDAISILNKAMI